ncbi:hypothetical protein HYPDE_23203 [Hyphomicrobium denitrificans 1NES1]|uniref:Uncharacterized protein n=1 Tax=Hyphomicrobium denitrificans 1NES1 TaxID=670307 RepID=N0B2A3_9HYPH|nr:hypothetical protein HYPDE_23203 [Hyphomicrobium denitrificans 1NES1]
MSPIRRTNTSCSTCNGCGFVWRGRMTCHEVISSRQGITKGQIYLSRLRDVCPECKGFGVTLVRDVQRTPWQLAFQ